MARMWCCSELNAEEKSNRSLTDVLGSSRCLCVDDTCFCTIHTIVGPSGCQLQ